MPVYDMSLSKQSLTVPEVALTFVSGSSAAIFVDL